ncbi:hypothetical protein [Treponema pallidum]|uniref:Uncharacterized protein TP_0873 n=5 Tax=Treponema pallidum TaxID=160 RepID=Y873_TREPA|nr:hypothetical protein [Treponema pallidum]O83843.1 RecName: Full=Uncharacterized protein TP_0873 [Treponema pallidum subsp. pallidum str. Nichols]AAC65847.1 predicted coding region TP0873 [Treponema pallidum subsp. pallidum str. Nichols]ACD71289.1 hypothetical protein TPASS_0873 [Treponema pallidum subsp. pallidum SS14]ADD72967.1 conserved hypothetical protein [Treponema pallidum subsp. pallidum str. Chicago]AFU66852.1 hypothetical protein TPAMA_0873 [Treponema pallidum subsp. pallidum str. 
MDITINGHTLQYVIEHEKTIGEVLGAIEAACKKEKQTVSAVTVNGRELSANELDTLFCQSLDTDVTLNLTTLSGGDVRALLREISTTLLARTAALQEIAVNMHSGNLAESYAMVSDFSALLKSLYHCFTLSDIADLDHGLRIKGKALHDYQREISPLLKGLLEAMEEGDSVAVGDIAEYELAPVVRDLSDGILHMDMGVQ